MQRKSLGLALALAAGLALGACQKKTETGDVLIAKIEGEPLSLADVKVVQTERHLGDRRSDGARPADRSQTAGAGGEDRQARRGPGRAPRVRRGDRGRPRQRQGSPDRQRAAGADGQGDRRLHRRHPEVLRNRKFVVIEQIEAAKPPKGVDIAPSATVTTLDQVQAKLDAARLPYQRTVVVVDTANTPTRVAQQLLAMPLNSLFQLATGNVVAEGQVLQVRPAPLAGRGRARSRRTSFKSGPGRRPDQDHLGPARRGPTSSSRRATSCPDAPASGQRDFAARKTLQGRHEEAGLERPHPRLQVSAVSPGATGTARRATSGPWSYSASTWWMTMALAGTPAAITAWWTRAPYMPWPPNCGSGPGWMLRMRPHRPPACAAPAGADSRTARPVRPGFAQRLGQPRSAASGRRRWRCCGRARRAPPPSQGGASLAVGDQQPRLAARSRPRWRRRWRARWTRRRRPGNQA
jgi:hypothetical protein